MRLNNIKHIAVFVLLFCLVGCAGVGTVGDHALVGVDGITCAGQIEMPPVGFAESEDKELLTQALGASGEGKLCAGRVFVAKQLVTVYRVWNGSIADQ